MPITCDKPTRTALNRAYQRALKEGKDEFSFFGQPLLTKYAKYLLEYIDRHMKEAANG